MPKQAAVAPENPRLTVPTPSATPGADGPKPSAMSRGQRGGWTPDLENAYRVQECGWRDEVHYLYAVGDPQRWRESGLIACVISKTSGTRVYFGPERECEDSHIHLVKMYTYR